MNRLTSVRTQCETHRQRKVFHPMLLGTQITIKLQDSTPIEQCNTGSQQRHLGALKLKLKLLRTEGCLLSRLVRCLDHRHWVQHRDLFKHESRS